ncbi:MAG: helix-turn-helix domain-containing protein [Verrucomicrobia bacterium]|nr:helix-turn-helix domain-containing protein [Verrucomicrobiota bacterium]
MDLLAKGFSQAEVARRCQVSETTSFRWRQAWLRKGPQAWKRGRLGRPPKNGLGSPPPASRGHLRNAPTVRGRRSRNGLASI